MPVYQEHGIVPLCQLVVPFEVRDQGLLDSSFADRMEQLFKSYTASQLTHEQLASQSALLYAEGTLSVSSDLLSKVAQEFIRRPDNQLYPFVRRVLSRLRATGVRNIVISGAPSDVLNAYPSEWPIDVIFALEVHRTGPRWSLKNRGLYQKNLREFDQHSSAKFGAKYGKKNCPHLDTSSLKGPRKSADLFNYYALYFRRLDEALPGRSGRHAQDTGVLGLLGQHAGG